MVNALIAGDTRLILLLLKGILESIRMKLRQMILASNNR